MLSWMRFPLEIADVVELLDSGFRGDKQSKSSQQHLSGPVIAIFPSLTKLRINIPPKKLLPASLVFSKPFSHELSNDISIPLGWKNHLPLLIVRG